MKASNSMERHCMNQSTDCGRARDTDPATSVAAAKTRRVTLRQRILNCMTTHTFNLTGWTGKELATYMDVPLNSITPRFAELAGTAKSYREAAKIKDSGQRRDGQIVWVLV